MNALLSASDRMVQYPGDKMLGCACAYTMVRASSGKAGGGKAGKALEHVQVSNVDQYVSSTEAKHERFFCHQAFTKTFPAATAQTGGIPPKKRLSFVRAMFCQMAQALGQLAKFMCPKISVGMGFNLFSLRN